jgi:hypothetical protein
VRGWTSPGGRAPLASTWGSGWRRSGDAEVLPRLLRPPRLRLLLPSERPGAIEPAQHGRHEAVMPGEWREQQRDSETGSGVGSAVAHSVCRFHHVTPISESRRSLCARQSRHVVSELSRSATPGESGFDGSRGETTPR